MESMIVNQIIKAHIAKCKKVIAIINKSLNPQSYLMVIAKLRQMLTGRPMNPN